MRPVASRPPWVRPEYLIEGASLGLFMVSACFFVALIEHPASPVPGWLPDPFLRRALIGLAMGATAIGIIFSAWGRRSGAHLNPAVTLTFLRLGKVAPRDVAGYILGQFAGGVAGVGLCALLAGAIVAHPAVSFVATRPGGSHAVAFLAEALISGLLMTVVLVVSNTPRLAPFTGYFAGTCVFLFITFEAPLSGMSMNPARTFGSAVFAGDWSTLWIYFLAPPLGMLTAAEIHRRVLGRLPAACAKLCHRESDPCLFCDYQQRIRQMLGRPA